MDERLRSPPHSRSARAHRPRERDITHRDSRIELLEQPRLLLRREHGDGDAAGALGVEAAAALRGGRRAEGAAHAALRGLGWGG